MLSAHKCWISSEDQCLPSTSQCLFPNDHKALLCSAEAWDPYNIYSGQWKALALWSGRAVQLLCSESGCSHSQENSWVCTHVATHVPLPYFSSEKTLPVGYFHSLRGISLLQAEVWNRLIYVNCLIAEMIFRRNVKAQRFKNNKLEKWLSYSFLTQFAVPEEMENVKNLNAFHRNYLERINNVSK